MRSREKLETLIGEFAAGRGPGAGGGLGLAVRTLLMLAPVKQSIREVLAQDPGELDRMLEYGARHLLQLRSDDAPELVTVSLVVEEPATLDLPSGG